MNGYEELDSASDSCSSDRGSKTLDDFCSYSVSDIEDMTNGNVPGIVLPMLILITTFPVYAVGNALKKQGKITDSA